ncbi:MAG: acyl-CoA dehydrogenase [Proteobacteria bacterium]|nr:acyl-CoA dehydrogenase [Pseudomonadota bacterium]
MAQLIADRRDVDFVLHEQLNVSDFSKYEKFGDFNKKTIDMIVSEARTLAIKEIYPTQPLSDAGCTFENGQVKVPESFHRVNELFLEGEWLAMADNPEYGGGGMPKTVSLAVNEYFIGANVSFMLYHGLTHGAARMIEEIGTEEQKNMFCKNLYSGKWAGTMLLTEPEAGSDVGALTTKAIPNDDGTYTITGNKIFISGGDHDLAENIIHPVLARVEGDAPGTKGISLFLVPKYKVKADGSLGEWNDVVCTGIEHKMGLNGSATCSLTLGGSGKCVGTLLGERSKGMRSMFIMMNDARQLVGLQGFSVATTAYIHALNYSRERIQGSHLQKPKEGGVPIIQHPDVRRNLLIMKSYVEGIRSLIYYSGTLHDRMAVAETADEKKFCEDMLAILTPIIKGYGTDRTMDVCSLGVQVHGGYGYCRDYPAEQLLRDCKIFQIYEGTNGIQAMDLLGRKIGMNSGKPFMAFLDEIRKTIHAAKTVPELGTLAEMAGNVLDKYSETVMLLGKTAMSEVMKAFIQATPLLDTTGDMVMAWMLLWRAKTAADALKNKPKAKDVPFYEGQIKTCEFFVSSLLPVTLGKLASINALNTAVVDMDEASFGTK